MLSGAEDLPLDSRVSIPKSAQNLSTRADTKAQYCPPCANSPTLKDLEWEEVEEEMTEDGHGADSIIGSIDVI